MIDAWIDDIKFICIITDKVSGISQIIHISAEDIKISNNIDIFIKQK